jgi:proteic killer suppression protein
VVIRSFRCRETARLFRDERSRRFVSIERVARRKLLALDAATRLEELAGIPGNRLEALRGDRLGQYSIRINERYRICFHWERDGAHDVEIVDYH